MKHFILAILSLSLLHASPTLAGIGKCGDVFSADSTPAIPGFARWRVKQTNLNQNRQLVPTESRREAQIEMMANSMEYAILQSSTPLMEFFHGVGVREWEITSTPGYGSGIIQKNGVGGLGSKGILLGSLLLPVSGHTGVPNARAWGKTDTYSIQWKCNGQTKWLVKDVKSLDLITIQELAIPLVKDQVVEISYHRSGSAGPYGYAEGRLQEYVWDGT